MVNVTTLSFVDGELSSDELHVGNSKGIRLGEHMIQVSPHSENRHLKIHHVFGKEYQAGPHKLVIRLDPGATLQISEFFEPNKNMAQTGPFGLAIILSENATLRYEEMQLCNVDKTTTIHLYSGATLDHVLFSLGNDSHSSKIDVDLLGEGASAKLGILFAVKNGGRSSHEISLSHTVPHAQSRQLIKGIIQEGGRANFHGHVHVARSAQKTVASQINRNLLLGPGAFVDTQPTLEIKADDVKCSHGATVGRISDEELFYLQSRAIPRALAQNMLVRGFANEVILSAKDNAMRAQFEKILNSEFFLEAA